MKLAKQQVPDSPCEPSDEVKILRARLSLEETLEKINEGFGVTVGIPGVLSGSILQFDDLDFRVTDAFNIEQVIDGCADSSVVNMGDMIACGVPLEPFLELVDENNLKKFGPGGYRHSETGKWIKPPGHKPPDIAGLLKALVAEHEQTQTGSVIDVIVQKRRWVTHAETGSALGWFEKSEDGFYNFWPEPKSGYWPSHVLIDIGRRLQDLNEGWRTMIENDPRINGESTEEEIEEILDK